MEVALPDPPSGSPPKNPEVGGMEAEILRQAAFAAGSAGLTYLLLVLLARGA